MSRLLRNGEVLGGTTNMASQVTFNNGNTDLTSDNVQDGLVEAYLNLQGSKNDIDIVSLSEWTSNKSLSELTLKNVCYGNNTFVAINDDTIYSSVDGNVWNPVSDLTGTFNHLFYGKDKFILIGDGGLLYYSADGIEWTSVTKLTGNFSYGCYGNDTYLVIDKINLTSYISNDGIKWKASTSIPTAFEYICYGNDKFVGLTSYSTLYYSEDGINWVSDLRQTVSLKGVCYGNGIFFKISSTYNQYSYDGINWIDSKLPNGSYSSVCYGNGMFIVVGENIGYYSYDCINWYLMTGLAGSLKGCCCGNEMFIIVGENVGYSNESITTTHNTQIYIDSKQIKINTKIDDISNSIANSNKIVKYGDITTWVNNTALPYTLTSICYHGGKFVTIGLGSSHTVNNGYYSTDGINWKTCDLTFKANGICYGKDKYIAVGENVGYSTDGIIWTKIDGLNSVLLRNVCYGNGLYVAVGFGSSVYTSLDGINWTKQFFSDDMISIYDVCYGNGKFIMVTNGDGVYSSTDGITWTKINGISGNLQRIHYGNGIFIMTGGSGLIYRSTDGTNWSSVTGLSGNLYAITYGNGMFAIMGSDFYYSKDGLNWTVMDGASSGTMYDIAYGNGKFVTVGTEGKNSYNELDIEEESDIQTYLDSKIEEISELTDGFNEDIPVTKSNDMIYLLTNNDITWSSPSSLCVASNVIDLDYNTEYHLQISGIASYFGYSLCETENSNNITSSYKNETGFDVTITHAYKLRCLVCNSEDSPGGDVAIDDASISISKIVKLGNIVDDMNDLTTELDEHVKDSISHITATDRTNWNNNTTDISKLNTDLTNVENSTVVNLLPNTAVSQTISGVTVTVNEDKTITLNGKSTDIIYINTTEITIDNSEYTLSGCPSGGSNATYVYQLFSNGGNHINDYGNGTTFSNRAGTFTAKICIASGQTFNNAIFKPMLEKGTVKHEYQPHIGADSIPKAIANTNDVVGGNTINLLPNVAVSQTISGVTVTVNDDKTITLNGKSTDIIYINTTEITIDNSEYTLSGCYGVGSDTSYVYQIYNDNTFLTDYGNGKTFSNQAGTFISRICIASGQTFNNAIFKPMLENGSVKHNYVPFVGEKYNVMDAIGGICQNIGELNENLTYSTTTETKVGTWIDGKPIYRKVVQVASASSTGTVSHGISNVDNFINVSGFCKDSTGRFQPIMRLVPDNVTTYGIGVGDFTSTQFIIVIGTGITVSNMNIILEYTKTV